MNVGTVKGKSTYLLTMTVITVEQLLDSVGTGNTSTLWVVVLEVVTVVDGTTTGLASVGQAVPPLEQVRVLVAVRVLVFVTDVVEVKGTSS